MRHRRPTQTALAVAVVIGMVCAFAGTAFATPTDRTITQPLTGTAAPISLFDTGLQVCDACVPDVLVSNFDEAGAGAQLSADISTQWTSDAETKVSYDDSQLRQGSTLPTQDAFTSNNGVDHRHLRPQRLHRTGREEQQRPQLARDHHVGHSARDACRRRSRATCRRSADPRTCATAGANRSMSRASRSSRVSCRST